MNRWCSGVEDSVIAIHKGVPTFSLYQGPNNYHKASSTLVLSTAKWYHLAGTYDGSKVRLWVNGKLDTEATSSGSVSSCSCSTQMGNIYRDSKNNPPIDGYIAEVRISKAVKYTALFKPSPILKVESDTLGLWHLNEGKGTVANDSATNGLTGVIKGATWQKAPSRP